MPETIKIPTREEIALKHPGFWDEYISAREAADMLGTTDRSLNFGRTTGKYGPPYHLWGTRTIRYTRRDIIDYMNQFRVDPAAAAA
jgi:hypothetical protein